MQKRQKKIIEDLLRDHVVAPVSKNRMLQLFVNTKYSYFNKEVVIEAMIWNTIRQVAETAIDRCQVAAKEQSDRCMRAA